MKKQRNKAILLDWDGVLARKVGFVPIWDKLNEHYQVPQELTKQALRRVDADYQKGLITNTEFWDRITSELKIGCNYDFLNRLFFTPREINRQLLEGISVLRESAYVGVVSNNFDIIRDQVKRAYGHYFDEIFFSCDTGYIKPSIEPIKLASSRFGVDFAGVTIVDDDRKNLDILGGTGVKAIHFKWEEPDTTSQLLERLKNEIN